MRLTRIVSHGGFFGGEWHSPTTADLWINPQHVQYAYPLTFREAVCDRDGHFTREESYAYTRLVFGQGDNTLYCADVTDAFAAVADHLDRDLAQWGAVANPNY